MGKFYMTPKDSNSYKDWIEKAERDLEVAKFLFSESDFTDTAGFQLHQAAEKSLKAFLLFHKNEYPLTHNLIHLINQCGIYNEDILDYIDECERINGYYIEARYPADMPINYPKDEIRKSIEMTEFLMKYIRNNINR